MGFTSYSSPDEFIVIEENGVRSFLFEGNDKAVLVDTCFSPGIHDFVREITDKEIMVIITHADGDHTGGAKAFRNVYMHPSEYSRYFEKNGDAAEYAPPLPLFEGSTVDIGKWKFEVILIPGHTPGSIVLLEREKRFLIGGDSLQSAPIYMFGPGRNMTAFRDSMEKITHISKDFDKIYSSHNNLVEDPCIVPELYDFANDVINGILPAPVKPEGGHMPPEVNIYSKGKVSFFL